MSSRLKKQYDRKVLATFDLIGCYFIDLFYNDLFLKAKHQFTTGGAKSLTDVYRSHIVWYMRGIAEKPRNYIEIMKKLLEYYNRETNTVTATLAELENKILSQFIPPEYYQDFNNADKEQTLHCIIIRAINQLGEVVLEAQMLGRIIDDHLNPANVQLLQERMTDIFISQREEYYSKFVNEISKNNGNSTVSRDQFKKLKAAYAEEMKKRVAAETDRDKAVQLLQAALGKISELEAEMKELKERKIATPQRIYSPVKAPVKIESPARNAASNVVGSVGLKLSDLTIDDRMLGTIDTSADSAKSNISDVVETMPRADRNTTDRNFREVSDRNTTDRNTSDRTKNAKVTMVEESSEEKGDNTEDSAESEESGEDSEEVHRRQKAALLNKTSDLSLGLDDDPGFGN